MADIARSLRRVARELLPPIVARHLSRRGAIPQGATFSGDYRSIAEATKAASASPGYEDEDAVRATIQTTRELRARVQEDPSRADSRVISNLAAFSVCLPDVPAGTIRVLDFGGGVGFYFFALSPFIARGHELEWTVCELPALARAGREMGGPASLRFVETLASLEGRRFDVAFASGSLQYVDDPDAVWRALTSQSDSVILSRLPLISSAADRLTVQTVRRGERSFSCPAWFFSEATWLAKIRQAGFEVVLRWAVPEDVALLDDIEVTFSGLAARRSAPDATR